jgi:hypothetical protein
LIQCIIFKFRKWHTCNYEWYCLYRSYENCRRPGVAILNMQMSKVPIISGYVKQEMIAQLLKWHFHFSSHANNALKCVWSIAYLFTFNFMQLPSISNFLTWRHETSVNKAALCTDRKMHLSFIYANIRLHERDNWQFYYCYFKRNNYLLCTENKRKELHF